MCHSADVTSTEVFPHSHSALSRTSSPPSRVIHLAPVFSGADAPGDVSALSVDQRPIERLQLPITAVPHTAMSRVGAAGERSDMVYPSSRFLNKRAKFPQAAAVNLPANGYSRTPGQHDNGFALGQMLTHDLIIAQPDNRSVPFVLQYARVARDQREEVEINDSRKTVLFRPVRHLTDRWIRARRRSPTGITLNHQQAPSSRGVRMYFQRVSIRRLEIAGTESIGHSTPRLERSASVRPLQRHSYSLTIFTV